jgi:cell wall-associated NlpC family hydrolase
VTADDVIAAARECIGTPFAHQGRIVGVGIDCAGVAVHVAKRMGLSVEEPGAYSRSPYRGTLQKWVELQGFMHRASGVERGDILLMRFAAEPQHLAIATGKGIVHAYEGMERVVEHDLDEKWRRRIVRTYRFKGLE